MTGDEARARCEAQGLHEAYPGAVTFIVEAFREMNERSQHTHDEWCGCGRAQNECERTTGEDGRIAWGQSWEGVYERLARAFGLTDDEVQACAEDPSAFPFVESAWKEFFCE
jgi:hypothetical protein